MHCSWGRGDLDDGGWTESDVRVFYGGADSILIERPVSDFSRGGFTSIDFSVGGQEFGATFGDSDTGTSGIRTNLVMVGPPSFVGHNGSALTLQNTSIAPSFAYECIR